MAILPLMPKATAKWLVENTSLTFKQIANFCGMHELEVQGIADGEVASTIIGQDPIVAHQLTREEIERCQSDPSGQLRLVQSAQEFIVGNRNKKKQSRYTPVARRQDKPDAVAWLLKHAPGVKDTQISKLIGTTPKTIHSIRDRSHWNWSNIKPRDPVLLGLCTQMDLDNLLEKAAASEARKQQEEEVEKAAEKK